MSILTFLFIILTIIENKIELQRKKEEFINVELKYNDEFIDDIVLALQ